ncbi:serine/threonine-protein kinase [Curtobacterium sp. SP.BCo]|uniref:serine/threonine-protein kinase n=1 Tax=Curtobacterium sp. SP.BCo TaxID=3435229 RepID=UPI003F739291
MIARTDLINRGGQGEVWRAQMSDGSIAAVKYMLLQTGLEDPEKELRRFRREVECQQGLSHAGIVPILLADLTLDRPYYVMPLAEGSLRSRLDDVPGPMPTEEAIPYVISVLEALVYAHREGIVHRDLKPENILFFNGLPLISDFGLVRRLTSGSTTITIASGLGTVQYAAPEQITGAHDVDERADVFSLGRILFEVLTGKQAWPYGDIRDVPQRYRHVVMTATQLRPEDRYQTAADLLRELRILANDMDVLRSPAERVRALIDAFRSGDNKPADEFAVARVLVESSDDGNLYLTVLPRAPISMLRALAGRSLSMFRLIVSSFVEFTDDQFRFDQVDSLGACLKNCFFASDDLDTRRLVLERLLCLGASHNRFLLRDYFVAIAAAALKDDEETYALVLRRIFDDNPWCKEFVAADLQRAVSLPPLLVRSLAAA